MRAATILHFVLTGLLALAVIALYVRPVGVRDVAEPSTTLPMRDGATGGTDRSSADRAELERVEAQIASLSSRLDLLAQEITSVQTAEGRVAVQPVSEAEPPPTEQAFRDLHEKTILAVIADDRARVLSEAKRKEVGDLVAAFWRDHQLPEDGREQVVSILMEQGRRAEDIFGRFPDGWPAEDDPRRQEWSAAWSEVKKWRQSQLLPPLDAQTTDQLRALMEEVWGTVFVAPHAK
jgi:hypothetical protein